MLCFDMKNKKASATYTKIMLSKKKEEKHEQNYELKYKTNNELEIETC